MHNNPVELLVNEEEMDNGSPDRNYISMVGGL